ncbi:UNVERIFIED_CONTAM: hypothetical protein RMT77_000315 [Armadillidium vulgare]
MSIPNVEVSEDLFRKSNTNGENASNEASDNSENEIDETNSTANEELKEESKGEIAIVSSGKIKTVEDKALQAILADRRRSIEEGRTSINQETVGEGKTNKKEPMKECEELQAARNPLKWIATLNSLYEKTRRSTNAWKEKQPMFEPMKEITYREFDLSEDLEYINLQKTSAEDVKKSWKQRRSHGGRQRKSGSKNKSVMVSGFVMLVI